MRVQLFISPKFAARVALALGVVVAVLLTVSFISEAFNSVAQVSEDGDVQLLSLNGDQNVPTWYSSCMLFVCAGLLAIIAAATPANGYKFHWAILSIIFLYLSADEAASIHEKAGSLLATFISTGDFSHYLWILLYGPLVVVFALAYRGFLSRLPPNARRLFFTAGLLYVGGALGMEVVDGLYAVSYGRSSFGYFLLTQVEEVLEMLGVIVFFYALLLYISSHERKFDLEFAGKELRDKGRRK